MHAGWREYLKQRLKTPSKFYSIGLEFGDDSIQVSVLNDDKQNITWVKQHLLPAHDWQKHLQNYVSQESLTNTPCHVVLSPSKYQIQQVEKPQVSDDELAQALVWSVKDLMPNQDEIVVDYFELPVQSAGANKVNVVALAKDKVEELTDGILHAGLELKSISILELIMADIVESSDDAILTLVQESGQEICLNIIKHGQVYFSRRLRGYENLPTFSEEELQMGVGDNLSVEIQRSMDYFESQLRQAPVKKILLAIESPHLDKLAQMMQQLTFMTVEPIHVEVPHVEGLTYRSSFIGSLGAAFVQKNGIANEN
ncbi:MULTISPECIES: type IV pilus biogenesis protein PilM [Alteromonadaceae]|uniref:type IV pilus biogenesis protein PilM n=1 Tax=Alteromonadaceae TaxID=72275 RepID=UPI001C086BA8|nr:pilus assembly protein PilM [Aliiglaciecola lipolytica]MBU2880215.1 pilus assembly protein PilM [Aliiglaciecola lipolytica]